MATAPRLQPARVAAGTITTPGAPVGTQPYLEANWKGIAIFITPSGHTTFNEDEAGSFKSIKTG